MLDCRLLFGYRIINRVEYLAQPSLELLNIKVIFNNDSEIQKFWSSSSTDWGQDLNGVTWKVLENKWWLWFSAVLCIRVSHDSGQRSLGWLSEVQKGYLGVTPKFMVVCACEHVHLCLNHSTSVHTKTDTDVNTFPSFCSITYSKCGACCLYGGSQHSWEQRFGPWSFSY